MPSLKLTYYPDITQYQSATDVRDAIVEFARILSEHLTTSHGTRWTIDVLPVVSVAAQTDMLAKGQCEIALIKPSSYIFARWRNPKVRPAAVALRTIRGRLGDTYYAQIYAKVTSGIRTLDDLKERCRRAREFRPALGFGDSFSTSNFIVNAALLIDEGLHPFARFRRVEFLGGHDGVAEAVYKGVVDVGAGHDGVITILAQQPGFSDAGTRLVPLASRDIHSDPVAVLLDDEPARQVSDALVEIGRRADVVKLLDLFWGQVGGLGPTTHQNYASIEGAIRKLGIPEADLLGI